MRSVTCPTKNDVIRYAPIQNPEIWHAPDQECSQSTRAKSEPREIETRKLGTVRSVTCSTKDVLIRYAPIQKLEICHAPNEKCSQSTRANSEPRKIQTRQLGTFRYATCLPKNVLIRNAPTQKLEICHAPNEKSNHSTRAHPEPRDMSRARPRMFSVDTRPIRTSRN